jgi:hypothetical protein
MPMHASDASPTVTEVLRFEDLPPGSVASRRAVVRWSDGTEWKAPRWYGDEVLICEGDLTGKTREQLRSPHFGGIGNGFHRERARTESPSERGRKMTFSPSLTSRASSS